MDTEGLQRVSVSGDPFRTGQALGRHGHRAVHDKLVESGIWREVTSERHHGRVARLLEHSCRHHPAVVEEIRGLAQGLELPFQAVFAWNCRGDLLANSPDGCTTVMIPGPEPCIAHNEDGLPFFDGDSFLASVKPDEAPAFLAFCYPGSIPGHTFALTAAGIVQTVNNLRLKRVPPGVPRMVLGRAMLSLTSLDEIHDLLRQAPASGGFHFTLAQRGDPRLRSIEVGAGQVSHRHVDSVAIHANHALHHDWRHTHQIVTRSSHDRQSRGSELIAAGERDPLAILMDTGGKGLPIYRREADDPDHENTLATGIFRLLNDGIQWEVHTPGRCRPLHGTDSSLFEQ
ncbi:6-aminopenicillanic acid acyl-transferase [Halomonas sp. DQ26W]|nr:6-aminopenicillanic acid acyl-transferase [Halomonas sp. DQ26W]